MPDSSAKEPSPPPPAPVPPWLEALLARWLGAKAEAGALYDRLLPFLAPSETKFLVALSILIGLCAGVFAFVFDALIQWVFTLGLGSPLRLMDLPRAERWPVLIVPALGGLAVGPLIKYFSPESRGHGVPEIMLAIRQKGGRIRGRVAALKALTSALTIGTGGSAGREGPIAQIGAAIGSRLAQAFRLPAVTVSTMTAAGAAAGIAAAFNAPLGGMAFSLEVVLRAITAGPFAMVVLATVVAATVSRGLHGSAAYFTVPQYKIVHNAELFLYLLLGIACGLLSKLFVWALYWAEDEFELRSRVDPVWQPALGGLLVGAVGFFAPGALGTGHGVIEMALRGGFGVAALCLLFGAKIAATCFTLGSGGSGGIFMPCLFLGAMTGAALGRLFAIPLSGIIEPGAYAMVGMAAFFAGATHAPLTAILTLFEMTYDYAIILPLMISVVTAVLVARVVEPESIYTLKLLRKGVNLRAEAEASPLAQVPVSEVMTKKVLTLPRDFPVGSLGKHFNKTKRTGFPVLDKEERLIGIVTFEELQAAYSADTPPAPELPVEKVMRSAGQALYPDDSVAEAARRMNQQALDRLPVVSREDPRKVVGIVSKNDVLSLYAKKLG